MLSLILSAAVLGLIIVVMEGNGEFPGWFNMSFCVLAAVIPMTLVNAFLPPAGFALGAVTGAVIGGLAISWRCGMSVERASIAAGLFLAFTIGLGFLLDRVL